MSVADANADARNRLANRNDSRTVPALLLSSAVNRHSGRLDDHMPRPGVRRWPEERLPFEAVSCRPRDGDDAGRRVLGDLPNASPELHGYADVTARNRGVDAGS